MALNLASLVNKQGVKLTLPCYRTVAKVLLGTGLLAAITIMLAAIWRSDIVTPAASSLITDRHGTFMAELESEGYTGYGFWPMGELPSRVVTATLALEDQRFWLHPGVDPLAIGRAVWQNMSNQQRISGASTLAMQLVRLQHPAKRSYVNKTIEALAAVIMTLRYGREAVLANYLRWVPYGNRIHGIGYAARRYLDKPVEDLSWAEIAFLAAIPQSPSRMNPFTPKGRYRAIQRGKRLLQSLHAGQVISDAEMALAVAEIRTIRLPHRQERPRNAIHAILKLEEQLRQTPASPLVTASIDLTLQENVTQLSRQLMQSWRAKGAGNVAAIVLDRHSNEVLAWIGSDNYFDESNNGAIDFTQIKRSSGSVLKPFIYALALERGVITANTIIDDLPMAQYPFRNSDHRFLGPMLPRQALGNSRNIPAIRVLNRVGLDETYGLFGRLALHQHRLPARHFGQGMALGSLPVRLQDVVRAYAALANEGRYRDLQWLRTANNGNNNDNLTGEQLFSPAVARLITLFLSDPSARLPTFPRMGTTEYAFPVALKTGTSQGYRDAWTVAYSKHYVVGVWVGHAVPRPMDRLNGAGSAAVLARQIMLHLHAGQRHGLTDVSFPAPDNYVSADLCATSGKLAGTACEFVYREWLPVGKVPEEVDNVYVRMSVDVRTGLPASIQTPPQFKRLQTMVNLPPRYADWIAKKQMVAFQKAVQPQTIDRPAALPRDLRVKIDITSPQNGLHILRNPDAPEQSSSIALNATVEPPIAQVVWYVDNEPYQLVDYPYSTRLQLQPGRHHIQARVPMTPEQSEIATINVE